MFHIIEVIQCKLEVLCSYQPSGREGGKGRREKEVHTECLGSELVRN